MKVGVLGGGQLGSMLIQAGIPLGLSFRVLDPDPHAPAAAYSEHLQKPFDDALALDDMSAGVDVVTYEFENVSVDLARRLADRGTLFPPPQALELSQDRLVEKDGLTAMGIPTTAYAAVASLADLQDAVAHLGLPAIIKTRRMGYDGKGQAVIRTPQDIDVTWQNLGGDDLILEAFVNFDRELSIISVRGREGQIMHYPLVENVHREGILRQTHAPATGVATHLQETAEAYMHTLLEKLDYVGVLALELFQRGQELIANEMAPRVHNSGHWTQNGTACSQFENHLRAVCGFEPGSIEPVVPTTMINLIGTLPDRERVLALPGAHLHLYHKAPRVGRKLGHINVVGDHPGTIAELLRMIGET